MATWDKIKIYYKTMLGQVGSTLVATSTEPTGDFDVDYLHNWLEVNSWQAADTTTPMYITFDAGVGNSFDADYLAIREHNLNTAGATIVLQYSTDNFAADINDAFTAYAPTADTVQLKEFTAPGAKRYWRLKITGSLSVAPYMAICVWGEKTELKHASSTFDPTSQEIMANINESYGGYDTGTYVHHVKRRMEFRFNFIDETEFVKFTDLWDNHGLRLFFIAWDTANHPEEVYLMRMDTTFNNPFKLSGRFREVSMRLVGRKE